MAGVPWGGLIINWSNIGLTRVDSSLLLTLMVLNTQALVYLAISFIIWTHMTIFCLNSTLFCSSFPWRRLCVVLCHCVGESKCVYVDTREYSNHLWFAGKLKSPLHPSIPSSLDLNLIRAHNQTLQPAICVCVHVGWSGGKRIWGLMLGWIIPLLFLFEVLPMERIVPCCP